MFKNSRISNKGFTLIELLVVIAIIGILSSVVLSSLNSAREKGKIASIKSNLKNMISQAELLYDTPGNYSTTCTGLSNMITAITNIGATSSCHTLDNTRWGVSTIIDTSIPIKAWSSSSAGVTTWDTEGVNSLGVHVSTDTNMSYDQGNAACALAGGRLPTLEELKSLSDAVYLASGSTHTPPSFTTNSYWSSTTVPSNSANAYYVNMSSGGLSPNTKGSYMYIRCVH